MTIQLWFLYLTTISMVIVSPGPNSMFCVGLGANRGFLHGMCGALGGATAAAINLSIALFFIGFISKHATALQMLQYVGAVYLMYIAYTYIKEAGEQIVIDLNEKSITKWQGYKQAAIIGLSNPNDLAFFIFLLPGFINPATFTLVHYATIVGTWVIAECCIMSGYVLLGERVLTSAFGTNKKILNYVLSGIFFVLSISLLVK